MSTSSSSSAEKLEPHAQMFLPDGILGDRIVNMIKQILVDNDEAGAVPTGLTSERFQDIWVGDVAPSWAQELAYRIDQQKMKHGTLSAHMTRDEVLATLIREWMKAEKQLFAAKKWIVRLMLTKRAQRTLNWMRQARSSFNDAHAHLAEMAPNNNAAHVSENRVKRRALIRRCVAKVNADIAKEKAENPMKSEESGPTTTATDTDDILSRDQVPETSAASALVAMSVPAPAASAPAPQRNREFDKFYNGTTTATETVTDISHGADTVTSQLSASSTTTASLSTTATSPIGMNGNRRTRVSPKRKREDEMTLSPLSAAIATAAAAPIGTVVIVPRSDDDDEDEVKPLSAPVAKRPRVDPR